MFAFQVRELAIQKVKGFHDYLELPEIIEDILDDYLKCFGCRHHDHYIEVMVPKIVKFKSSLSVVDRTIENALAYAYTGVRGEKPDMMSAGFISTEGEIVPQSAILNIESFPRSNDF